MTQLVENKNLLILGPHEAWIFFVWRRKMYTTYE